MQNDVEDCEAFISRLEVKLATKTLEQEYSLSDIQSNLDDCYKIFSDNIEKLSGSQSSLEVQARAEESNNQYLKWLDMSVYERGVGDGPYHQDRIRWQQIAAKLKQVKSDLEKLRKGQTSCQPIKALSEIYFTALRDKQRSQLKKQILELLSAGEILEASRIYDEQCSEWWATEDYVIALSAAEKVREAKKNKAIQLNKLVEILNSNFLHADDFYRSLNPLLISEEEYNSRKIDFVKSWFALRSIHKIDNEQALAIATVNGHVQLVARAGGGKTETLSNRAVFLQLNCGVKADEMLLVAFNRKASHEMEDRIKQKLGDSPPPYVMTFHALAYAITHSSRPENILFDGSVGENQSLSAAFQIVIDDRFEGDHFQDSVRRIMLSHFKADWDAIVSGGYNLDKEEMIRFRRNLARETLRGEYVKSYGEKCIANFLFEHGIPYRYEQNHWWGGYNYRPDFTLLIPDDITKGIVLEYYGLMGDQVYDEMTDKKRKYWYTNPDWQYIELDIEDFNGGTDAFELKLKNELEDIGIKLERLSEDEIWLRIKERAIDSFTKAMAGFVGRCRKSWILPNDLLNLLSTHEPLDEVEVIFVELAWEIYESYLLRLQETGEDDFDGLMQSAIKCVEAGNTSFLRQKGDGDLKKIKYLFIDEYQDFSVLFHRLVEAVRKSNPNIQIFCVGDDWQSINGFAGSDLKFYREFQEIFSPAKRLYLSTNYRSVKSVVEIGNALMKGLGAPAKPGSQENGEIFLADLARFSPTSIEESKFKRGLLVPILIRIISNSLQDDKKVMLLSRRNSLFLPGGGNMTIDSFLAELRKHFPAHIRDHVGISTAHKFKGKESDVVIILDAFTGTYPLIHPNWVFSRILGESCEKIIDENRRLFYVALTRARHKLFVLTEHGRASPFIDDINQNFHIKELIWDEYPPFSLENKFLVVKVIRRSWMPQPLFLELNRLLQADTYSFRDSREKSWDRVFYKDSFDLNLIKYSIWSKRIMQEQNASAEVFINDDFDNPVSHYRISDQGWDCIQI